jgi:2,3-bisphosphoglycerate-dependent phosphoglycerate mutase
MDKQFNLYLVRHGESHNNAVPQSQRVCDPPLTARGRTQSQRLGERIAETFNHTGNHNNSTRLPVLERVYTSAFLRTMQTVHPATEMAGLQPQIWTDLFEVGGCFDGYKPGQTRGMPGMTRDEIAQQFPAYHIPDDIDADGWWKSKPRETTELAHSRATTIVDTLHQRYTGKPTTVLCVIHGDLIRLLLQQLVPEQTDYARQTPYNTSVTQLRFSADINDADNPPQVVLYNDTSHLNAELLSV